jgi:holo-[acyl-carrier protein] synthase
VNVTKRSSGPRLPYGAVVGHGVDVVDIQSFTHLLGICAQSPSPHFTSSELAEAGDSANRYERLAGRFAIKESVMKALGVGWGDGIAFTDIEVRTDDLGAPTVTLRRKLLDLQNQRSISRWSVSASHTGAIAFASAIGLCDIYPSVGDGEHAFSVRQNS